jgi:hypothetical protein
MSKARLAELCSVSPATMRYYLNVMYIRELEAMDYRKNQRLLTPRQWGWLCNKLVITD